MNSLFYVGSLSEMTPTMSLAEDAAFPLANLLNYDPTTVWKSSANTNGQTLKFDFGNSRPRNFAVLDTHNLGLMTTVVLQAADDAAFSVNLTTVVSDFRSLNTVARFVFPPVRKRYWRILFTDTNSVIPQIGQVFIDQVFDVGDAYDFPYQGKDEQFQSTRAEALDGFLRTAQAVVGGRLLWEVKFTVRSAQFRSDWQWFLQKVGGAFAPFYFMNHLGELSYMLLRKDLMPVNVKNPVVNEVISIVMESQQLNQNTMTQQIRPMAVDLDGLTEYAKKTPASPSLNMNPEEVINGGFETGGVTSWGYGRNGGAPGTFVADAGIKHGGSYSGRLTTAATEQYPRVYPFPNGAHIPVQVGKRVLVYLWYKVTTGTLDTPNIRVGDGTVDYSTYYYTHNLTAGEADGTWQLFLFRFTAVTPLVSVQFQFVDGGCTGGAVAYLDDVSVSVDYDFTINLWSKPFALTQGFRGGVGTMPDGGGIDIGTGLPSAGFYFGQVYAGSASENRMYGYLSDPFTYASLSFYGTIPDTNFHLWTLTATRDGYAYIYRDGVLQSSTLLTAIGTITNSNPLALAPYAGYTGAGNLFKGQYGELQIVRGYAMTAAQILDIYKFGIQRAYDPTAFPNAEVVAHYRWQGSTDAEFLKDETGWNTLTGTGVTQPLDQVEATYPIREFH